MIDQTSNTELGTLNKCFCGGSVVITLDDPATEYTFTCSICEFSVNAGFGVVTNFYNCNAVRVWNGHTENLEYKKAVLHHCRNRQENKKLISHQNICCAKASPADCKCCCFSYKCSKHGESHFGTDSRLLGGFQNTLEKHQEIRGFAKTIIENNPENWIDEWHQIDGFHDVHISDSDQTGGKIEVWVYPVVINKNGFNETETTESYEVIL